MFRLVVFLFCLSFWVSCASQPQVQPQKLDVEAELRKDSQEFSARNPESIQPVIKSKSISKPSVMVLPAGTKNLTESMNLLNNDSYANAASNAINGYLTEKQFNVKALEGSTQINDVVTLQNEIAGQEEDLSYIASLSFGADVYIKFSVDIRHSQILANLSAYESTSGRMLGTQTSTVNDNGTRKEELIASAMHKALPGLLRKVQAYWDADSQFGTPYKLILHFNGDFSNLDVAHSRVSTLLKQQFVKIQTNAMTDKTSEYTIYVNSQDCGDSYEVYNALRAALGSSFEVKKRSLVQRLLIVELY